MSALTFIKMYILHLVFVFFVRTECLAWQKVVLWSSFHWQKRQNETKQIKRMEKMSSICTVALVCAYNKCLFKWREGRRLFHFRALPATQCSRSRPCYTLALFRPNLSSRSVSVSRPLVQRPVCPVTSLHYVHTHALARAHSNHAVPDRSQHPEREISEKIRKEVRGWICRSGDKAYHKMSA